MQETKISSTGDLTFPQAGDDWSSLEPDEAGIDPAKLREAITYSQDPAHEGYPPDLGGHLARSHGSKRYDDGLIIGPTKTRGPVTGVALRNGRLVAEWGEPHRVDMTFSVTKSFLSTVAGLAWDQGLIKDVHDPVADYVDDGGFDSDHNRKITWDMMLRQINEWDGSIWGKHYSASNPNDILRPPAEPGTVYEYSDARVNRLALALLRVWKRPLPEVLKEQVMDPIGASDTWRWNGYRNSWVMIAGQRIQSVSGGGHWGGGMWISARDQARFGMLSLARGNWAGNQIISEDWVKMARTPGKLNPNYGFMNWTLNTDHKLMPNAPADSFFHSGAGTNRIWVVPSLNLVVVLRWVGGDHFNGFVDRLLAAVS